MLTGIDYIANPKGPMQAREELIESVCQKEVGVYQQIFSTTGLYPCLQAFA